MNKKAIVVHSGGMDSSLCLALAKEQYGAENILAMTFTYGQRHLEEISFAKNICSDWKIDHIVINLDCLNEITSNALIDHTMEISNKDGVPPNTLVVGRNGLMARISAIHAESLGANCIFMGVMELEEANSGYRDCSRKYMDIIQAGLRMDFADSKFEIKTPLVYMTKKQTMELGYQMGILYYLLENTLTCYNGIPKEGCGICPACKLKHQGLAEFIRDYPDFEFSYKNKILT